jgi:hypothetical protein
MFYKIFNMFEKSCLLICINETKPEERKKEMEELRTRTWETGKVLTENISKNYSDFCSQVPNTASVLTLDIQEI